MSETYNGWRNHATWNVALWIGNDEGLYEIGRESRDYAQFVSTMGEIEAVRADLDLWNVNPITIQTPDGVAWNDSGLDTDALDDMIEEL